MSLTTKLGINATADLSIGSVLSTSAVRAQILGDIALADGVATGRADSVIAKRFDLGATDTEIIDFASTINPIRRGTSFSGIKALMFKASVNNAGALAIQPDPGRPWFAPFNADTDVVRLEPGGCLLLTNSAATGWAVSSGADRLAIENLSGAQASVEVVIVGISDYAPSFDSTVWDFSSTVVSFDAA